MPSPPLVDADFNPQRAAELSKIPFDKACHSNHPERSSCRERINPRQYKRRQPHEIHHPLRQPLRRFANLVPKPRGNLHFSAVAYQEIQDFSPFDTIVYSRRPSMRRPQGGQNCCHFPQTSLLPIGGYGGPVRTRRGGQPPADSGVPGPGNSELLRAHHPCPLPRGHRLQRSPPATADDEGAAHPPAPPAGGEPHPDTRVRQNGGGFHDLGHPAPIKTWLEKG